MARCAKYFLKFDLQDSTINLNEQNVANITKFQTRLVINFLNKMFGNSTETEIFWKQLNKQSLTYFKYPIDRKFINPNYLMQSIQYHLRIKLKDIENVQFFMSNNTFRNENFVTFTTNFKVYDLNFTELYTVVNAHLNELKFESYEQLRTVLNLNRRPSLP